MKRVNPIIENKSDNKIEITCGILNNKLAEIKGELVIAYKDKKEIEKVISDKNSELKTVVSTLSKTTEKIKSKEQELERLDNSIKEKKLQLKNIEKENKIGTKELSTLEKNIILASSRLYKDINELSRDKELLENELKSKQETIDNLRQESIVAEDSLKELYQRYQQIEKEYNKQISVLRNELEELSRKKDATEIEWKSWQKDIASEKEGMRKFQQELNDREKRLNTIEARLKSLYEKYFNTKLVI